MLHFRTQPSGGDKDFRKRLADREHRRLAEGTQRLGKETQRLIQPDENGLRLGYGVRHRAGDPIIAKAAGERCPRQSVKLANAIETEPAQQDDRVGA